MAKHYRPTFIDLCCGAGGFSFGLKKARWTPLLGVDACPKSLMTFASNVGAATLQADLLSRNVGSLIKKALPNNEIDVVIAGPPCQGFSRAGRRNPLDPRNRVFVACARLAARLNPKVIIFENVPSLGKKPFRSILLEAMREMKKKGYAVRTFEIEAGRVGIAQRRTRLFLVGFKRVRASAIDDAIEALLALDGTPATVRDAWRGLPSNCTKGRNFHNHISMEHSVKVQKKIARIEPGTGPLSYRKLHPDLPALTLIAGHSAAPCHYRANRTITVREAARIQSFDDSFVFQGGKRSELLQVANAVPPKLAFHAGQKFRRIFERK